MATIPQELAFIHCAFSELFSKRIWEHAVVLLTGAILATGKRTVTAILRISGLSQERHFQNYHRVLNRDVWSCRRGVRNLLLLLIQGFAALNGPLIMGLDDTLERCKGGKIKAIGIYRDAVRSSRSLVNKTSGLRWLCLMLLAPVPWAKRIWALPFFTVLAPSERYHREQGKRHKKLTDWARQMLFQVRRWLPQSPIVVVADSSFAALELLGAWTRLVYPIHCITRLRLDAALYDPAPPRQPGQMGRSRCKGERLPTPKKVLEDTTTIWTPLTLPHWYSRENREVEIVSRTAVWYHPGLPVMPVRWVLIRDPKGLFDPQALLCTDTTVSPKQILAWFAMRWQVEVTFEEVRAHLGVETQRQWSDLAITRTTPVLMALFSIVTLLALNLTREGIFPVRQLGIGKPSPRFPIPWPWYAAIFGDKFIFRCLDQTPIR